MTQAMLRTDRRFILFSLVVLLTISLDALSIWDPAVEASEKNHFGGLLPEELISADQLKQKRLEKGPFIILDARSKKNYEEAHIEGAFLSMTPEYYHQEELFRQGIVKDAPAADTALEKNMELHSKKTAIITYCNSDCQASAVLVYKLKRIGFTDVRAMEDGFQSWEKKGYPVVRQTRSK
ncbi:MAG: hypothetical protein AUJ72_01680 [Candidatus Omnitrophica bacterium CG1_02_46_14]|nr:MAG: hypothetical protein AUJ72_01680 [Candidatus Omnitrophica bacterium CG1_02_46_14]